MAKLTITRTEPTQSGAVPLGARFTLQAQGQGDGAQVTWLKGADQVGIGASYSAMAVADSAGSYTATATIDGQAETSESYMLEVGPKLGVWARVFGRDRKSRFVEGLWGPLAFGGVLVVGYGICQASCAVLMVAAAVGSAAFVAGALVGFLFGIPRSLTSETAPLGPPVGGTVDPKAPQYRPNTNLEQVSDWLTKILLGAGLAQMHSIVTGFGNLVDGLVPAMGADGFARAFAGAEIIYFVIAGFLSGYLLTRLRLQRELELHAE